MAYTEADLKAAFAGADQGTAATNWYRRRGHATRDNAGLCQGIANAALAFTLGRDPDTMANGVEWFLSATDAWRASPTVEGDIYNCEVGTQLHYAIPSVPDGHVLIKLEGRGRFLHAHELYSGESWGLNMGVTDLDWFLAQRPWYVLRGLTRTIGPNRIVLTAPAAPKPAANQRQVGDSNARRRTAPVVDPANVFGTPHAAGTIITPAGFVQAPGLTPAGSPIDFVGENGLWYFDGVYYSSASVFTESATHDLVDLTVPLPPVVVPDPDPEPVDPTPDPDPAPDPDPTPDPDPVISEPPSTEQPPVTPPKSLPAWVTLLVGVVTAIAGMVVWLVHGGAS